MESKLEKYCKGSKENIKSKGLKYSEQKGKDSEQNRKDSEQKIASAILSGPE